MIGTRTAPAPPAEAGGPPARTPSQALRRVPRRRPDPRAVVGAVFLGLGLLGTVVSWSRVTAGDPVLVATRAIAAGERLGPADVAVARVRVADRELAAAWVPASERDRVVGLALAAPVQARQVLVRSQLGGRPLLGPDRVAFAIPVGPDTAAGGQLRPGDTVAVYVTWRRGQAESRSEELLAAVPVYEVGYGAPGAVLGRAGGGAAEAAALVPGRGTGRAPTWLSLALSREQAAAVAQARWNGELDVALVPAGAGGVSAGGVSPQAPPVQAGSGG